MDGLPKVRHIPHPQDLILEADRKNLPAEQPAWYWGYCREKRGNSSVGHMPSGIQDGTGGRALNLEAVQ